MSLYFEKRVTNQIKKLITKHKHLPVYVFCSRPRYYKLCFYVEIPLHVVEDHPQKFKFVVKILYDGPSFQTIFPFLMTMVIWMFNSHYANNKNDKLHKLTLKIVYSDYESAFDQFFEKHHTFSIYFQNTHRPQIDS